MAAPKALVLKHVPDEQLSDALKCEFGIGSLGPVT
jgi:hypothetical protein